MLLESKLKHSISLLQNLFLCSFLVVGKVFCYLLIDTETLLVLIICDRLEPDEVCDRGQQASANPPG